MLERIDFWHRARAAGLHLIISAVIAGFAAALVFGLWFRGFYRSASGGTDLFLLLTSVDVILGPLLTFAVFNLAKGWKHLRRDLAIIGLIQAAALGYGLHTVYSVRPIAMVFEADRFRIVVASGVYLPELPNAPPGHRALPLTGPWLLAARQPNPGDERKEAIFMSLRGFDVADRPIFWRPYPEGAPEALAKSRPVSALLAHYPARAASLRVALADMNADEAALRFVPLVARTDWVVVLDAAGSVRGAVEVDGFF